MKKIVGRPKRKNTVYKRMIKLFLAVIAVFLVCFWGIIFYMNQMLNKEYEKNVSATASSAIGLIGQNIDNIIYSLTGLSRDDDVLYLANTDYESLDFVELTKLVKRLQSKIAIATPSIPVGNVEIHFTRMGKTLSRNGFTASGSDLGEFIENTGNLLNEYRGRFYIKTLLFPNFYIVCELDRYGFATSIARAAGSGASCSMKVGNISVGETSDCVGCSVGISVKNIDGIRCYLSVDAFGGAEIYTLIEADRITGMVNSAMLVTSAATLVIVISVVAYVVFGRGALDKPLSESCSFIARLGKGEYGAVMEGKYPDEFGKLIEGLNLLSTQLETLVNIEFTNRMKIRDMQLKQLQGQMNPHFLFNCFTMLKILLTDKKYELACELDEELCLYFKTSLGKEERVSLIDELSGAGVYANIQNKRKSGRIRIEIKELPFSMYALTVPKFILQPLVENAFEYAFKDEASHTLSIDVRDEGEWLYIDVFNDGGISDAQYGRIVEILNEKAEPEEMSALDNINRRLKIFNRTERGVEIKRGNGGLTVTVCLLKKKCLSEEKTGEAKQ